ncbi:hypothetical protein ACRJ4B_26450 [Streptomyces sp. GTA36]
MGVIPNQVRQAGVPPRRLDSLVRPHAFGYRSDECRDRRLCGEWTSGATSRPTDPAQHC